jgi:hypothetical protein
MESEITSMYRPKAWVVVSIEHLSLDPKVLYHKVYAELSNDSWRMNSGITKIEEDENSYSFYGASGSCYLCMKDLYGINLANSPLEMFINNAKAIDVAIKILPKSTNFLEICTLSK